MITLSQPASQLLGKIMRAHRDGKPGVAAKLASEALLTVPVAEVPEFVRRVRVAQGVQDLSLLPTDVTYTVESRVNDAWVTVAAAWSAEDIQNLIGAMSFTVSWPSLYSHWGVSIQYASLGTDYRVQSSDWQLTETYLSS